MLKGHSELEVFHCFFIQRCNKFYFLFVQWKVSTYFILILRVIVSSFIEVKVTYSRSFL